MYQTKRVALALLKPAYVERCRTFPAARDILRTFAEIETIYSENAAKLHAALDDIADEDERAKAAKLWEFKMTRHLTGHTFDPRNPMLDFFYAAGTDIETIFCINAALQALRSAWRPTSGAGSQTGIECQAVVNWYQSVAEDVDDAYREYEYQVQCRNEDEADMTAAFDTNDDTE